MSDKYQDHLIIIPEDDHNRQIIIGFVNSHHINQRQIDVENNAGGWDEAVKKFEREHLRQMAKYPKRHVLIVIDFDEVASERLSLVKSRIPPDCIDRVFFLGTKDEPRDLKAAHKLRLTYEEIGQKLASDFSSKDRPENDLWQDGHIVHNLDELARLCAKVRKFVINS